MLKHLTMDVTMTAIAPESTMLSRYGDEERMRALYEVNSSSLLRTMLGWTRGDRQAAEDLVQETMLRAWLHLDTLHDDPQTLRPWLLTVARRLAIDSLRARASRPAEVEDEDESLTQIAGVAEPFEQVLDREVLRVALHGLSAIHRTVLVQVYFLNQSIRQTAHILGVPEGTVKSRTHNALRALREQLGDLHR